MITPAERGWAGLPRERPSPIGGIETGLVLFLPSRLFQQALQGVLRLGNDADLVVFELGLGGHMVDGIAQRADCQRALKTSHRWALENQPL